jgi:periplasmic divalent cation tolerance protein
MIVIYTTVANKDQAKQIISTLLQERLIACANAWDIDSYYVFQGTEKNGPEVAIYFKTAMAHQEAVYHRLLELHPYDCPAIISLDVEYAHPAFAHWVEEQTGH